MNNFTVTFKNSLLCENRVKRQTIQFSIGYGYIIGKISFPILSDGIGRRKCMLLDYLFGILMLIFLIYGIQRNNYIMMIVGQVFSGIFSSGISALGSIYACDFCTGRIKQFCLTNAWAFCKLTFFFGVLHRCSSISYTNILHSGNFTCSTLMIPICILLFVLTTFLIESPVYSLFIERDQRKFSSIIQQISKYNQFSQANKQEIKKEANELLTILAQVKGEPQNYFATSFKRIFCFRDNLKIISLMLIGLSYVFFYFGIQVQCKIKYIVLVQI